MPKERHSYIGPLHPHYEYDPDCECHGTGDHTGLDYECGAWAVDPSEPTPAELAEMLRGHARGEYAIEATVELLIAHDHWLQIPEFLTYADAFLAYTRPGRGPDTPRAVIRWTDLAEGLRQHELLGSSSELNVLRIACSLASVDYEICLRAALSGLDDENVRLVIHAIAHASGHRQEWPR